MITIVVTAVRSIQLIYTKNRAHLYTQVKWSRFSQGTGFCTFKIHQVQGAHVM